MATGTVTKIKKIVVGRPISTVQEVRTIGGLGDTQTTGVEDGYFLVYNAATGKWVATGELTLDGGSY